MILDVVARMVEAGTLRTTLADTAYGAFCQHCVRQAHLRQASETMVGKQVIVFLTHKVPRMHGQAPGTLTRLATLPREIPNCYRKAHVCNKARIAQ